MPASQSQAPRPNVLLVLVDQWPGRLLGAAGHPVIQTPTIDQIARNGVRFTGPIRSARSASRRAAR
jgi:arylsulfatase A-like enzyme